MLYKPRQGGNVVLLPLTLCKDSSLYEDNGYSCNVSRPWVDIDHLHIVVIAEPELLIGPCAQPCSRLMAELLQVQASLLNSEFSGCENLHFFYGIPVSVFLPHTGKGKSFCLAIADHCHLGVARPMNLKRQGIVVACRGAQIILLHVGDHRNQLVVHLHKPRWRKRHCSGCGDLVINPCLRTNLALQNISCWTLAGPLGDIAGP